VAEGKTAALVTPQQQLEDAPSSYLLLLTLHTTATEFRTLKINININQQVIFAVGPYAVPYK